MAFIFGLFVILHGLVHLLYFGQSIRLFELQPGMVWPSGSWLLSGFISDEMIRLLAGAFCILSTVGFTVGGIGVFFSLSWIYPMLITTAIFSSLAFVVLWDAKIKKLNDKGGAGIILNILIIVTVILVN